MRRLCWLALIALAGCGHCGGDAAVAELAEVHGDVAADDAPAPVHFEPAAVGRRFVVGDAVRTGDAATARLRLAGGGTLRVEPQSLVRFQRHADAMRVDVEQGETEVEAPATAPVEIETVFGVARLEAHARARFGARESRFEIVMGRATVEREGAPPVALERGAAIDAVGAVALAVPPRPPPARDAGTPPAVAPRAVEVRGDGATMRAVGAVAFVALAPGHHDVGEGSVLRADEGTAIDIRTADGTVHVDGAAEVALVEGATRARHGHYRVEGGGRTRLALPGGALVLAGDPGASSADVVVARDGSGTVTVRRGEVVHETAEGLRTLHAPDVAALAAAVAVDAGVAAADAGATAPDAGVPAQDVPAPARTALTLRAGENAAIHDPNAPTRVRLEAQAACASPVWRVDRRAVPGGGTVVATLRPGSHALELRCTSAARTQSTVRVDRDAGRAALPRTAPRNVVDADGRAYSLLYPSILPEVLVRWPHAPASGPYDLEVRHGSATRTVHSATASTTFTSGQLGEGTHVLTFRAADGSRSPPTTVRIRFDNATPVATIRSPAPGAPLSGSVTIDGAVAEGGAVSVSGRQVPLDGASRFHAEVPSEGGCLAIRVAVAARGVHYFVRCRE